MIKDTPFRTAARIIGRADPLDMSHLYLIALDIEALRARTGTDLAVEFERRFSDAPIRVVHRGYAGRSVTVEMSESWIDVIRSQLPFVTIERAREMELLEGRRSR